MITQHLLFKSHETLHSNSVHHTDRKNVLEMSRFNDKVVFEELDDA